MKETGLELLSSLRSSYITYIRYYISKNLLSLKGIISGPLCRKLGCRPVAMMGGFFGGLGLICASFSTQLVHLSLSLCLSGKVCVEIWCIFGHHH